GCRLEVHDLPGLGLDLELLDLALLVHRFLPGDPLDARFGAVTSPDGPWNRNLPHPSPTPRADCRGTTKKARQSRASSQSWLLLALARASLPRASVPHVSLELVAGLVGRLDVRALARRTLTR